MKSYNVVLTERFKKEFKKLDKNTQSILCGWIDKNLAGCTNPRQHGKGLTADKKGFWRYRIGDYRIISLIDDNELIILAMTVGHRKEVYR